MPDDINYPSKRIFGAIKRGSINAGVINGVAFNIDSDGLCLRTVKDHEVSVHWDTSAETAEEIEFEIGGFYYYWPTESLQHSDITPEFIGNFATSVDDQFVELDNDGNFGFGLPDFHLLSRQGTVVPMSAERRQDEERRRAERQAERQRIAQTLLENQRKYHQESVSKVTPEGNVTAENVLRIVRTSYPTQLLAHAWVEVQPVKIDPPPAHRTFRQLVITGGPYRGLVESGIHPWRLILQEHSEPVQQPTTVFYLFSAREIKEIATHVGERLPLWKRKWWEILIALYGKHVIEE